MRFVFSVLFLISSLSYAAATDGKGAEDYNYSDYYLQQKAAVAGQIDLLDFDHINSEFPQPADPYNRSKHFGSWINPKNDDSCFDTRGLVLERDTDAKMTVSSTCRVQTGLWHDPYSGQDFESATMIQIDHLVPLKHAYMTGAFEWDANKRCLYANYMGDKFHLISVSAKENLSKSDRSPLEFMPSDKTYHCQYLKNWLETKFIWELRLTPREVKAITELVKVSKCSVSNFKITQNEYQEQLTYMSDHQDLCRK